MFDLETIAIVGAGAALVVSILSLIIMGILKKNIINIVSKDAIIFDQNFTLKKQSIETAMAMIDEIMERGQRITMERDFQERAKNCYNQLLCVVSDIRLADQFADLTINPNGPIAENKINAFKLACRKDMGLSTKHARKVNAKAQPQSFGSMPTDTQPIVPPTPVERPTPRPMQRPSGTNVNPIRPVARPVQPTAPTQQPVRPINRPRTDIE